jgi:putative ABC transport system substrate-binding protein
MHESATRRRLVIGTMAAALIAAPVAIEAQQPGVPRIGFLGFNTAAIAHPTIAAFRQGLLERGWVDGRNVVFEVRLADGKAERLPGLAAELVSLKVDVIVAASSASNVYHEAATAQPPSVVRLC